MSQQADLIDQIFSGANRNLQVLAASGLVPIPPQELIPIQVALAGSPDPEISSKAAEALQNLDPGLGKDFLSNQAGETELRYFGLSSEQPIFLEAILRRMDSPRDLFVQMASRLQPDLQEILVLRQDAIVEEPGILIALEQNPGISSYCKRRIWEYREHLLPKDKVPPKKAEDIVAEADALTEEEIKEAIEEVKEKEAEGKLEETTGLTAGQIRLLPIPVRVKMGRNADRQIRNILIHDTNTQVALAVLLGNSLPDSEVEQIASSRNVVSEVLAEIPKKREWIRKYAIAKALVKNPRTQLAQALRLVPRMTMRDLRELARDKNVPDGVRSVALRLYQVKR